MASIGERLSRFKKYLRVMLALAAAQRRADALDYERQRLMVASLFASPVTLILGAIIGALLPYFSWIVSERNEFLILTWISIATLLLRVLTIVRYHLMSKPTDTPKQVLAWDREYFIGATAASTILGLNCYFALTSTHSPALHVISIASTIAFASGFVARNAGRPNFVFMQLFCCCIPSAVGLFKADESHFTAIGYFMILWNTPAMGQIVVGMRSIMGPELWGTSVYGFSQVFHGG